MKKNNTTFLQKKEDIVRNWLIFDAKGQILGRFASEIAKVLCGKHRPEYTPAVDCGDGVIIINADKIKVTGSKRVRKIYRYYTGSMRGLREVPFDTMIARHPTYPVEHAVKGMLPKTRLASQQLSRLRIFAGEQHDMQSQKPTQVNM
jgi:large subunit ribosomal protein L13